MSGVGGPLLHRESVLVCVVPSQLHCLGYVVTSTSGHAVLLLLHMQCALIITANSLSTGWYGVALQIEDFASTTSTTPMSSIPLQFLVFVFSSSASCASRPMFVGVTPPDGSCYPVASGSTWTARIVAQSGSSSVRYVY